MTPELGQVWSLGEPNDEDISFHMVVLGIDTETKLVLLAWVSEIIAGPEIRNKEPAFAMDLSRFTDGELMLVRQP